MELIGKGDSVRNRLLMIAAGLAFVGLIALLYAMSWNPRYAGFLSDDAVYLLMADGFSPYRPVNSALFHYVMRQSLFPPFYPMLLALFGGGSAALLVSHWITTTTLVLSLLIYAAWAGFETGNRFVAVWSTLVLGLLPGILLQNLEILSEFPYLLLSLLALKLAADSPTETRTFASMALCVGFAAITRSAGLSLVLAFAVWLFLNRSKGSVRWIVLAILPSMLWFFYKALMFGGHAGYGSLWWGLWQQVRDDGPLWFIWHFITRQSEALWYGLLTNFDSRPSLLSIAILAVVLLVALPVWMRRLLARRLDAWYLLIGGGMIVLYPFPSFFTRLLLPWIPILLLYSCLGVSGWANRWKATRGRQFLSYGFLAALTLTLLPSSGFIAHRFFAPIDSRLSGWKHTRYWFRFEPTSQIKADLIFRQNLVDAAREVPRWVPEGDCVFGVYTAMPMLYSRRIFQQPPAPPDGAGKFSRIPQACRYYFLMSAGGDIGGRRVKAFYPYERLPAKRIKVIHVWMDIDTPGVPSAILLNLKSST